MKPAGRPHYDGCGWGGKEKVPSKLLECGGKAGAATPLFSVDWKRISGLCSGVALSLAAAVQSVFGCTRATRKTQNCSHSPVFRPRKPLFNKFSEPEEPAEPEVRWFGFCVLNSRHVKCIAPTYDASAVHPGPRRRPVFTRGCFVEMLDAPGVHCRVGLRS